MCNDLATQKKVSDHVSTGIITSFQFFMNYPGREISEFSKRKSPRLFNEPISPQFDSSNVIL